MNVHFWKGMKPRNSSPCVEQLFCRRLTNACAYVMHMYVSVGQHEKKKLACTIARANSSLYVQIGRAKFGLHVQFLRTSPVNKKTWKCNSTGRDSQEFQAGVSILSQIIGMFISLTLVDPKKIWHGLFSLDLVSLKFIGTRFALNMGGISTSTSRPKITPISSCSAVISQNIGITCLGLVTPTKYVPPSLDSKA